MRERGPGAGRRWPEEAAALGGQEVRVAAMAEVPPDELLAAPVVDRCVDQVDPPVEHLVEQPARVLVLHRRAVWLTTQLHGPVAEDGHVRSGPPQGARLDR